MAKVLLIDDDLEVLEINKKYLSEERFTVYIADSAKKGIAYAKKYSPDCILLDIMMPEMNGLEVCKRIRSFSNAPIIFLTGKSSEDDKITGLTGGADDYIVKPFSFDELLARIRAVTRVSFNMASNVLSIDDLELDCASHTVKRAGKEIILSSKEFALLEYLMRNKGIVLSREHIENHIWGFEYEGGTNVVDVYISYLRKKIDGASDKKLIRTVRGSGYTIKED